MTPACNLFLPSTLKAKTDFSHHSASFLISACRRLTLPSSERVCILPPSSSPNVPAGEKDPLILRRCAASLYLPETIKKLLPVVALPCAMIFLFALSPPPWSRLTLRAPRSRVPLNPLPDLDIPTPPFLSSPGLRRNFCARSSTLPAGSVSVFPLMLRFLRSSPRCLT